MTTDFVKAGYWSSISGFAVANIDSRNFTHLFCAFAELDPNTYEVTFPTATMHEFQTFTQTVQRKNPDVKTLLSIGGPTSNPATFAAMASRESNRTSFITSSIELATTNNFHGLDLSWLYPSTEDESRYFRALLSEWHNAILNVADITDDEPLLLTAQVFCSPNRDPHSVRAICRNLDWINVLPYNFHSPDKLPNQIGGNAPSPSIEKNPSGEAGVNAWIEAGLDSQKVVLGLAFVGYAWLPSRVCKLTTGGTGSGDPAVSNVDNPVFISHNIILRGRQKWGRTLARRRTPRPAWLASFISNLEVVFGARMAPIEARLDSTEELMKNMRRDQAQISATLQRVGDKLESMSHSQEPLKDRTKGMGKALARIENLMQDMSSIPTQLDTVNEGLDKLSMSVADIIAAMPNCQGDEYYCDDGSPRGRCGWD
ncbi:Chitinase-3-like protein 2 [Morella rubra]|uniref:Chitinase-3-like protein 2 n=1 Tax=Morella rubra TaxID=262757 RepID=A0A6A1VGW3_9ROSI|nr:Chitinase-3-like protein 2 [Morella rubra]